MFLLTGHLYISKKSGINIQKLEELKTNDIFDAVERVQKKNDIFSSSYERTV